MEVENSAGGDVSDDGVSDEKPKRTIREVKQYRSYKNPESKEYGKVIVNSKAATPNGDVNSLDKDDASIEDVDADRAEESPKNSCGDGQDDQESVVSENEIEEKLNDKDGEVSDDQEGEPSENDNASEKKSDASKKRSKEAEKKGKTPDKGGKTCEKESELPVKKDGEVSKEMDDETSDDKDSPSKQKKGTIKKKRKSADGKSSSDSRIQEEDGEEDDDDVGSDSDAEVLAEIVKSKKELKNAQDKSEEKSDKKMSEKLAKPSPSNKDQTIIVTETKSLAQAINEAVKQPDGKPTLVIIETKSPSTQSGGSNGIVTTTGTSAASKSAAKISSRSSTPQPFQNSLRSALLQGTFGMATRSQTRPPALPQPPAQTKTQTKADGSQGIALQDDAEVNVYTPSLLVPYLFESAPKENLSEFLRKIAPPEVTKAEEEKRKKEQEELDDCEPPLPSNKPKKTYFDTALGQFFVDIGLSQVQQWVQTEILKAQKRKLAKGWKTKERESMVVSLTRNLRDIKEKNQPFMFELKKCKRCNFLTESQTVLDHHLETIHVIAGKMFCSFCEFMTAEASQIFHHLYIQHKAFGRLERPLAPHMCPVCTFEDSAKARVTRHMWKCLKTFVPEKNMTPAGDFEPPAKRLRHLASVATLKAMRAGVERETAAINSANLAQQRQAATSLLSPLLAQHQLAARGVPQPIRPKPGDLRLTPTYVQSVLRGAYGQPGVTMRNMSPSMANRSIAPSISTQAGLRPSAPSRAAMAAQAQSQGAYLTRQQNTSTITPISSTPPTFSIHGNQLYQVVQTSSTGVPLMRPTSGSNFTPPRFTILPTTPATVNTRGPTPVALIPNLATTNKPATVSVTSSIGISSNSYSTSLRSTSASSLTRSVAQLSSKPNISITPVSRPTPARSSMVSSSTPTSKTTISASNSGQQSRPQQQGNPSYVVCEICDGYIKDLDQLRNHMQWIHKVKIHPKMIHNRPPLNCQKCHFRFFTDQGLERHLLGSHGLVTSSMQENANKGKDGGRCIICGKVFLWKLVIHMAKDHKMTLKPAHLSYKCTVCSATFNMYRLFETHVYEEHSTVAKRVLDGQKSYSPLPQAAPALPKSKVTITPSPSSTVATVNIRKALASTRSATAALAEQSKLIETRFCVKCGKEFKRSGKCTRHWEKTNLKPCHVKLCRIDTCDKCIEKGDKEDEEAQAAASNGRAASGKTVKKNHVDDDCEIVEETPPPAKKVKTEVEIVSVEKNTEQSDGDDVFDMEVETVDDHHSSGDAHTDVESD